MDESRPPHSDEGPPPPEPAPTDGGAAAAFRPLRLVLQPTGTTVDLDRPDMVLGRHSEADVRLPLPDVSRRHCRFVFTAEGWRVEDLGSLNGVHVNDVPVQQAPLRHGDLVRIGGFTFAVDLGGPGPGEESDNTLRAILRKLPFGPPHQRRRAS
jgi:pSer/pThr/pTyr-binding forkhead associated (FHA) protein